MAIDTAQKRRSVAGNSRRWRAAGVTPQAAKSAAWRRDAGRTYSGNTAGYTPSSAPDIAWLIQRRNGRNRRR